ncbi:STAS domain-containing protein, partial [Actinomadura sp. WAC 06369]|uniref:STAS domain-containing protein n=1 Tax=Actinomadura sp. WAC 06369 TaxID=2203193 RepID=UPI0010037DCD
MSTTQGHIDIHPTVVLSVVRGPEYTVVALQGDLDLETAPALHEELLALMDSDHKTVVLDLAHLGFCDAAGLSALISASHRALARGVSMRLAAPRPRVAGVLAA